MVASLIYVFFFMPFQIMREVELQRHLKHENVVAFHSFFEDDEYVYIVMENCSRKVCI